MSTPCNLTYASSLTHTPSILLDTFDTIKQSRSEHVPCRLESARDVSIELLLVSLSVYLGAGIKLNHKLMRFPLLEAEPFT